MQNNSILIEFNIRNQDKRHICATTVMNVMRRRALWESCLISTYNIAVERKKEEKQPCSDP